MKKSLSRPSLSIWLEAIRLHTLPASIAPVIMGTAMAFGDGIHHWPTAIVALLGAVFFQIGTNLANDYFDYKNGVDTVDRQCPLSVLQAGLVTPKSMQSAFIVVFLFAALISYWLFLRAGWPIALIGGAALLTGLFYTAGPYPLSYLGLGEIFVFLFFGPIAVSGTYYVQSFEVNLAVILAGCITGFLSTAILVVNNLRDIETDKQAKKQTLAVRFGENFARFEYFFSVTAACLLPVVIYLKTQDHVRILLAPLLLLIAFPAMRRVFQEEGEPLNYALAYTGIFLIIFTIVFSVGWIL